MIWIAVDAMGGDDAPRNVVDGALAAVRHFDLGVLLVGHGDAIEAELDQHSRYAGIDRDRVRIVDAPDVVGMEESPSAALRRKPGASIRVAADAVARGEASALFSAGHTGATVMAAHARLRHVAGRRSAGAGRGDSDARAPGTAARCRRERRVPAAAPAAVRRHGQHVRARGATTSTSPRIGLLSIGHEETKGNELTREAHQLLKSAPVAFIGNVEASRTSTAATPT